MDKTANSPAALRPLFQLRTDIHFLNHGSFGATPKAVQRAANRWRTHMERQPVAFLGRELEGHLAAARRPIGASLNIAARDVAFVPNATVGVNIVARSLAETLQPGDEILTTDHEYGACINAWHYVCGQTGARLVRQPLPLPDELPEGVDARATLADALLAGVTERTRLIFLSHITSPTAVRLPVEEIVAAARARGILTLIDGAHAPGQVNLDLAALDADFYTGNFHKWQCAPKGSAFLYVRPELQAQIRPLVVSWGWGPERNLFGESDFQDALRWSGTTDFSAWLAVPSAIHFQQQHDWRTVRERSSALLDEWLPRMAAALALEPAYGAHRTLRPPQMAVTPLPQGVDAAHLKQRLYDEYRIELPFIRWRGRSFLRISVQGYNDANDLAALETALRTLRDQGGLDAPDSSPKPEFEG